MHRALVIALGLTVLGSGAAAAQERIPPAPPEKLRDLETVPAARQAVPAGSLSPDLVRMNPPATMPELGDVRPEAEPAAEAEAEPDTEAEPETEADPEAEPEGAGPAAAHQADPGGAGCGCGCGSGGAAGAIPPLLALLLLRRRPLHQ